jgi:hypothetical protein
MGAREKGPSEGKGWIIFILIIKIKFFIFRSDGNLQAVRSDLRSLVEEGA